MYLPGKLLDEQLASINVSTWFSLLSVNSFFISDQLLFSFPVKNVSGLEIQLSGRVLA
jgi:hypothetical protein